MQVICEQCKCVLDCEDAQADLDIHCFPKKSLKWWFLIFVKHIPDVIFCLYITDIYLPNVLIINKNSNSILYLIYDFFADLSSIKQIEWLILFKQCFIPCINLLSFNSNEAMYTLSDIMKSWKHRGKMGNSSFGKFSLFNIVFKSRMLKMCKNVYVSGKGLSGVTSSSIVSSFIETRLAPHCSSLKDPFPLSSISNWTFVPFVSFGYSPGKNREKINMLNGNQPKRIGDQCWYRSHLVHTHIWSGSLLFFK